MNEINIYARYNYRKLIKNANLYFDKNYKRFNTKSVFAPFNGTYSISIGKYNIHISYWDEHTKQGILEQKYLKEFLKNNIFDMNITIDYDEPCDIVTLLKKNNTLL